ncbi:snf2 family helicase atpase protein [Rutstroemia sp. NJR-2017a BBW]|nr:snf2 family helicase atpase protein [Rutstroemia sp. NJR-2017a BBW]
MSSYFGNNTALVPDSPAVKRQKTASGYTSTSNSANNTNTYNSDVDSGDDLFAGYVPDTPAAGRFETQPTQIIDRSAPALTPLLSSPIPANKLIQVPASSPFNANTGRLEDRLRSPTPVRTASPLRNIASAMAPAGTAYRAPVGISKKPAVTKKKIINLDSDDEGPSYVGDSSDEDTLSSANIKPTTFAPKLSQTTSRSFGSQEQPKVVPSQTRFQSIVANAAYNPSEKGTNPAARKDLQRNSSRALPIDDLAITDIGDEKLRANVVRLRNILPKVSVLEAKDALLTTRGDINAAAALLVQNEGSDDDIVEIPAPQKVEPQMRRGLAAPIKSIKDRYSSTQAQPTQRAPPVVTPQKPKRKLMKGRKEPTSPVVASPSPVKLPSSPPKANDSYDSDSGMEEPEESEDDPVLEERLRKYLNKCTLDELIELTSTTKANAEAMLAARPFRTLDTARNVSTAKTLKSGKKSSKAAMGDRLVDTALSMFSGYEAVDALVAKCEELSKPLEAEMAKWGFNTFGGRKEGEGLELVSFEDDAESQRDSGIGSPSSTPSVNGEGVDDDKIVSAKRRKATVNFLKKPELMAESVVLKDYQIVGLNWLNLMYNHNLSCILADDMGLGKTCQVISFLSHLVATGHPGPHVVFGPAAVFENWCQEFVKFAPNLAIQPYHGQASERVALAEEILENKDNINVVVSTYDMAVKKDDNKFFRRLHADVLVCDEGHILKNGATQKNQALNKIPAKFRLLLTGTPLQNNLVELVTLLAFILPEVFEEREEDLNFIFKAKATTRDTDHGALLSAERIARARSMLTPFVLRRKKHQVLKHLPTKTCRVERCSLTASQSEIYNEHADAARERARKRLEGVKVPTPKSDENNPIMQLRKAAIHPLLFRRHFTDDKIEKMADILRKKEPTNFNPSEKRHHLIDEMRKASDFWLHSWCMLYPCIKSFDVKKNAWMDSGKVAALVELVKKYKENGDRVLIFSQFSLVLDILEAVLNSSSITYTRIDGSTKIDERQAYIERFRDDTDITAFLLTTKAGGTGINLMYANKVIIFDGGFNPQDDVQAENRAHRVGQTRDVEVVRLVTRGTIEEAIWKMGRSKLMLDGRVAGEEEEAGEKAVEKMLLEGVTITDEEAAAVVEGKPEEETDKNKAKDKKSGLPERRKSTLLDLTTEDGEEMLV